MKMPELPELPPGDVPIWGASDTDKKDEIVRRLYSEEMVQELVLAVREECAKLCEAEALHDPCDTPDDIAYDLAVRDCAAAIRDKS